MNKQKFQSPDNKNILEKWDDLRYTHPKVWTTIMALNGAFIVVMTIIMIKPELVTGKTAEETVVGKLINEHAKKKEKGLGCSSGDTNCSALAQCIATQQTADAIMSLAEQGRIPFSFVDGLEGYIQHNPDCNSF